MPRMARYLLSPKGLQGAVQDEPDEASPDPEKSETKALQQAEAKAGKPVNPKKPSLSSMIASNYRPRKPR